MDDLRLETLENVSRGAFGEARLRMHSEKGAVDGDRATAHGPDMRQSYGTKSAHSGDYDPGEYACSH